MAGGGASRRDLLRLLGRSVAGIAGERVPGPAAPAPARAPLEPPAPAPAAPMEGGRLVVDLATFPILAGAGLRLQPAAWPDAVLVVRVSEEHYAAVTGDCPHCGGPVHWEATTDSVLCPRARASFRLDGSLREGAGDLRLRSFPCRRAGPRLEVDLAV